MTHKTNRATTRPNIPAEIKKLVSQATFTIRTKKGGNGQSVLIEGSLIITAAHCLDWNCTGMMTLGERYLERIATGHGDLIANTLAVEPVTDCAVLGCPDNQTFYAEAQAFDDFCERITPLTLHRRPLIPFKPFPVWIRTHLRTWVSGTATYYGGDCGTFAYQTDIEILSGTSGGPIVNHAGELVGVVSNGTNSSDGRGKYDSAAPLLSLALPAWVLQRATTIQRDN